MPALRALPLPRVPRAETPAGAVAVRQLCARVGVVGGVVPLLHVRGRRRPLPLRQGHARGHFHGEHQGGQVAVAVCRRAQPRLPLSMLLPPAQGLPEGHRSRLRQGNEQRLQVRGKPGRRHGERRRPLQQCDNVDSYFTRDCAVNGVVILRCF